MVTINQLTHSAALLSGADLWILPHSELSEWTRVVDWYLNFQISRSHTRTKKLVSPQLLKILSENPELEVDALEIHASENAPLLVSSSALLPNQQTMELKFNGKIEEWVEQIHQIWLKLKKPSFRLFLPDSIDDEVLVRCWKKALGESSSSDDFVIQVVRN